jgi:hypothetical protein
MSSNRGANRPPAVGKRVKHFFERSLATGIVRTKLKIAKVVPIFKSGDANDVNKYRRNLLLSTFSKILEIKDKTDSSPSSTLTT